jgi:branched-chain amino acid transport system ATP-binding protein
MARLLEVSQLEAGYGKSRVLADVTFHVDEAELVALIGSNGAGKTTLLKAVSGLLRPWSGEISLEGERIDGLAPDRIVRMGIAHCPEGRRVFAEMSVAENLRMGAYARSSDWQRDSEGIWDLFPRLGERRSQLAGTLSGGEQQMLAIGRALMSKPKILLLDEPSLGLAPLLVGQVIEIVEEVSRREHITTVLVEQNASAALRIADRAYVLEGGRFVTEGPGADLLGKEEVRSAYLGI